MGIIDCKTYVEEAILGGYKLQRLQYLQFPTIFGMQRARKKGKVKMTNEGQLHPFMNK